MIIDKWWHWHLWENGTMHMYRGNEIMVLEQKC